MYRLKDLQGVGTKEDRKYKSKGEVVDDLTSFHDIDFGGTDDKDRELSIEEYFKFWKIKGVQKQLDWLLDYGSWGLIKC